MLPNSRCFVFDDEELSEGEVVEFRLIYKGQLHAETASKSRAPEKHSIRKEFHKQLKELWKQHPVLRRQAEDRNHVRAEKLRRPGSFAPGGIVASHPDNPHSQTWVDLLAEEYSRFGYRFVPLVRKLHNFSCSLDILFLRRDNPGSLIKSGGDIDNRIKVLLDALRLPSTLSEAGNTKPEPDENPFFVLLEDDDVITSLNLTTDRLLLPQAQDEDIKDVMLIIGVRMVDPQALFSAHRLV